MAENPRLRIRLLDFAPIEIETGVLNGTPDFALTTLGIGAPELVHEVLSQEPFILACPANHELATRDAVEWTDLADVQLIGIGPQSANRRLPDARRVGPKSKWMASSASRLTWIVRSTGVPVRSNTPRT